jgi:hypothetical protein
MKATKTNFLNQKSTRSLFMWAMLPLLLLFTAGTTQAQLAIKYPLSINPLGTYTSIAGTTAVPILADQIGSNITGLPAFTVNGVPYTNARMSSNGWLALYSATAPTSNTTAPLSAGFANGLVVLAPFGADLDGTGRNAWRTQIGNELIFEWQNFNRWNIADVLNFQIRLNIVTGEIKFVYGTCTAANNTSYQPQVGIKTNGNLAGNWATDVNNLMIDVTGSNAGCTWANAVTGNAQGSTMYFNSANAAVKPNSGLTYTWTPQSNPDPVRAFNAPSAITGTTANISWTAPTGATQYNVQYRIVGDCNWTSFVGNPVAATNATLTGLTASTSYQVRVQASTGVLNSIWSHVPGTTAGTGVSGYNGSGTFTTSCPDISSFPYVQDFNGVTFAPTCWLNTQQSGTGLWDRTAGTGTNPAATAFGAGMARFNCYSLSSTTQANLISQAITFPTDLYRVSFKMFRDNGYPGTLDRVLVYYNTAPNLTGATLLGTVNRAVGSAPAEAAEGWYTYNFNMPIGSTGSGRYVILSAISAFGNNIFVDDFTLEQQPSCNPPTGLTMTQVTGTTANISWTAASPVPGTGYEWFVSTSVTPPGSGTAVGSGVTSVAGVTVTANTTNYLHLRSNCGAGVFSAWSTTSLYIPPAGQIGPISGGYALPIYSCYGYNYSQQIYKASEIGIATGAGNNYITKIRFYYQTSVTSTNWDNWTIYMGNTAQASFSSATNWVPLASLTQVFSGALTLPVAGNWIELTLNTPFLWDGTSNIVIATDENIPSYNCTAYFGGWNDATIAPNGRSLLYYSDGTNPDPASPPAANGWYTTINTLQVVATTPPSCLPPTALVATATSGSTANISWTAPIFTSPTSYEYAVTTSATPPGSGTNFVGLSTSVGSLLPNTTYYLHVRSNCGSFSTWATSTSFITPCNPVVTFPYTETFESSSTTRSCWSVNGYVNGTTNWTYTNGSPSGGGPVTSAFAGTSNASFYYANYATITTKLISPELNINGFANPLLSFYMAMPVWAGDQDELRVYYKTSLAGSWNLLATYTSDISSWTQQTISLPSPSATYYLAFEGDANYGRGVLLDNVRIENLTCYPPTALSATAVNPTTCNISWTAPVLGTPAGYEYAVTTSIAPPGSGTPTASLSATGVTAFNNVTNYLHVRTDCGAGDFSTWATIPFFTNYCPVAVTNETDDYITNFSTIGTISDINNNSTNVVGGYQDFTAFSCSQYAGLNIGFNGTVSSFWGVGASVFVDWNNDLDFNDANEAQYSSNSFTTTTFAGFINIPVATAPGAYRMRVVIDEFSDAPTACGTITYGEYEDYTVTVLAVPACNAVTYAATYVTNSNTTLICTGQSVNLSSSPAAPYASNITYRLERSTLVGGPYSTVAGPQATNEFTYAVPSDGFYRIVTLCSGSPVAAAWTAVGITISDPVVNSTTPASGCGTSSLTLAAVQTPAAASLVWYATAGSSNPLGYGATYNTPSIASTTTYYVQAENLAAGTANVGTDNTVTADQGVSPYSSYYENARIYYLFRKGEISNLGLRAGNITSLAWETTIPGDYPMLNYTIRMAHTTNANINPGFSVANTFTTVYTNPSYPVTPVGWNTITFSTPFVWNGTDNIIIEVCHAADVTGAGIFYGSVNTEVSYSATAFNSVYAKYQDNAATCGLDVGTEVISADRPNIRIGGQVSSCASPRVPVVATINAVPSITPMGNQVFAPTISSFNPIPLTATSVTPGATVNYTPASSIYVDALTSGLYTAGDDINGITQYFAPLSTTTYSAVAVSPNGCTASAPFTITVDVSGIPNSACAATNINTTNTLTYTTVNTLGAVPGIGFPCGGIANQVWFKTTVPASGEVHVVTKQSGVSLTDLTGSNIAMFTSVNCSTITNTACNNNGGPGNFSYAYTQAPVGSTVYIRVSGLLAETVQNGKALIAVTSGLVWTPTNGDNASLAENWQGGDATAITTPSANQSVIVTTTTPKPKLYANLSVRSITFNSVAPYYTSNGIDLNGNTLSVKGNWAVGPVASATAVLNCNGTVEFNGTTAQAITSGKTTFGNLTLNNSAGLTLSNTTNVTCLLKHPLGTITTGGFLVMRSTAANNASIVDPTGTGSISGNVSVERKIGTTSGYHYLSAAVSGAIVNNTTTGWRDDFTILSTLDDISFVPGTTYSVLPTVWEYQEFVNNPNPDYGWHSSTGTTITDAITPLKGFACVVPGNVTVDVYGPINNGNIPTYSVTLTDNGLNLLGNPYPSPISWNSFRSTNASALSTQGYKAFVTTGGYAGSYGTWDGVTGTSGLTDRIASSQAFMATATGNTTVTASNLNRLVSAADLTASFYGYTAVPNLLRMDVNGNGYASQTAIYFDNARSDAYDNDATAMFSPNSGVPTIYSLVGTEPVNINAMGQLNMDKVVPLGVKIQTAGTYNLVVADMSSFAPSVIAYLEDTQAGTMTNLRTNPSYTVTLAEGDINNRFFLHFHPAVELNTVNETCTGNDGKLMINYPTTNTVNIVIKDVNGNVVASQNNVSGSVAINNLVAGNYVAEMTFGIAPNTYTTSDYFTVAGGNAVFANLSASANSVDMNANTTVNFTATAQGATSFNWNFGDGTVVTNGPANMSHTFAQAGTYNVTFEASNGICNTTATTTVEVTNATGLTAIANSNLQVVGLGSKVVVRFGNKMEGTGNIEVINMLGEVVAHLDNVSMKGTREIEMSNIAAGQYMVKITNNNKLFTEKVYLSRQ